MARKGDVKHVLKWSLPSVKNLYLEGMNEAGPITTTNRKRAIVFPSKREAMLHPANFAAYCGFEPVPR